MRLQELLPQIQSEETVTENWFIAFSWLHNVLEHGGMTKTGVKRAKSGKPQGKKGSQGRTRAGMCDIWPDLALSLPHVPVGLLLCSTLKR